MHLDTSNLVGMLIVVSPSPWPGHVNGERFNFWKTSTISLEWLKQQKTNISSDTERRACLSVIAELLVVLCNMHRSQLTEDFDVFDLTLSSEREHFLEWGVQEVYKRRHTTGLL